MCTFYSHTYVHTYLPTYLHTYTHTLRYGSVRNAMRVDMVMKMYTP